MPQSDEPTDFAARAAKARELAASTNDPEMAQVHSRLANSYAELAELMPPPAISGRRSDQRIDLLTALGLGPAQPN